MTDQPELLSDPTSQQIPVQTTEETPGQDTAKKDKKTEQLKAAREAKLEKKKLKDKENQDIRDALLRLNEENAELKNKSKRKRTDDGHEDTPTSDSATKRSTPVKVTRDKDDDEKEEPSPGKSFTQQATVTGIVGLLGLASWYAQNRLFQASQASKSQSPANPKTQVPQQPIAPTKQPAATSKQNTFMFTKPQEKKVLGTSGFTL